ncbi:leucine-rich repeat-containing protein 27-like [Leuresthes tenuis]|uniref:leucine-rich repeat-containing protein 27-like n=1 Tax=Leuresthes tenuis TaxID=355514 RepID=UPI003B50100C
MTPPEKEDSVQPRFVFGNTVVKPQSQSVAAEDAERQESAEGFSTEMLCLRRSNLKQVPGRVLKSGFLTYLSLEGNQICSIPDTMFISLPLLQWLDLRKNQITSLPVEIGSHRSLQTLLLEGNPISELPLELGNVITLRGLNLRDCPIQFPPQDVVHQGLRSILQYLRRALAERPVSARKTSPVVEKLQLSELMGSNTDEQEESVDEHEMQKFRELKDKFILLDKAELGLMPHGDKTPKPRLPSITKRKTTTTKAGIIPELPLYDTQPWKRPQEKRQAFLEQRKMSQEALQRWRTQAKATQERKISEHKQKKQDRQKKQEEADPKPGPKDSGGILQRQALDGSTTETEQHSRSRSARELERQIRARVERIQERRRNPRGSMTEQMAAAEEDLEEMRKLQERLLERKKNLWRH